MKLGKFKRVDVREVWQNEEYDFTPWLAKKEHLGMLGDAVGIEMELEETEGSVGGFFADIVAKEIDSENVIVIENQFGKTDHGHLGKLLTYASGRDARYVIWLVEETREEHVQAVQWLNEHTGEKINFFLVKVEVWRIDNSAPAVRFNVIVEPNEWTKVLRGGLGRKLTEIKQLQLEFWKGLREYAKEKETKVRPQKPRPQGWTNFSIGRSDCHGAFVVDSVKNELRCEIYIPKGDNTFKEFEDRKEEIENSLKENYGVNENIEWQKLEGKTASRICIRRKLDIKNRDNWEEGYSWLMKRGEAFKEVFGNK